MPPPPLPSPQITAGAPPVEGVKPFSPSAHIEISPHSGADYQQLSIGQVRASQSAVPQQPPSMPQGGAPPPQPYPPQPGQPPHTPYGTPPPPPPGSGVGSSLNALPEDGPPKPGLVWAIAIMTLVAGIISTISGIAWIAMTACLWLFAFGELVVGIFGIVHGIKMINDNFTPPNKMIAIGMCCCILDCNVLTMTAGILTLVFMNMKEVRDYYELRGLGY